MVLGAHDLNFMLGQTAAVESVQSLAYTSSFPPVSDLSMIRLSVPARIGIESHDLMSVFHEILISN